MGSEVAIFVGIILLLTLLNGLFSMSEIAVVSARKALLQKRMEDGDKGAQAAFELSSSPSNFLSTIQVFITLIGVLQGMLAGKALTDPMAEIVRLIPIGFITTQAENISLFIVTAMVTYVSLVLGELVPKAIALSNPEGISSTVARFMQTLASIGAPAVNLLSASTNVILRPLGISPGTESAMSEDEVRSVIDQSHQAGILHQFEAEMVDRVLEFDKLTVGDLMTPQPQIVYLNLDEPDEANWAKIAGSGHSAFPVFKGQKDNVLGMVSVKSLFANLSLTGKVEIRPLITQPLYVPENMPSLKLVETFKKSGTYVALVTNEFGSIEGLVALHDVLVAIVGELPERVVRRRPQARLRDDGSWLVDAMLDTDQLKGSLDIDDLLPGEEDGEFQTLGGFVLHQLGHIPEEGEAFEWGGYMFEIIDMDRQRIDKVQIRRVRREDEHAEDDAVPASGEVGGVPVEAVTPHSAIGAGVTNTTDAPAAVHAKTVASAAASKTGKIMASTSGPITKGPGAKSKSGGASGKKG
ncbi:hypothetical protein DB346_06370 [Verrucomicrobia bacterium LW23]|nr:hypothetical protein DB346_06370 [Verrucomicrobia bacterium LW23]